MTSFQGNNINNSARSDWDKGPSSTRRPRLGPTCGNSNPSGGISITIITVVTYTTNRPATTSPRIRLAVPVPTPTTPTRPHRRLPVHTSGLPAAPRLIRIATSAVLNMAVSSDPVCDYFSLFQPLNPSHLSHTRTREETIFSSTFIEMLPHSIL